MLFRRDENKGVNKVLVPDLTPFMKRYCFLLFFIISLMFWSLSYARENNNLPPEGMEIIKVGNAKVLVPKGTRVKKEGDMNVVESISEYSSRKFTEIDKRFKNIEKNLDQIKEDILKIKSSIDNRDKPED